MTQISPDQRIKARHEKQMNVTKSHHWFSFIYHSEMWHPSTFIFLGHYCRSGTNEADKYILQKMLIKDTKQYEHNASYLLDDFADLDFVFSP